MNTKEVNTKESRFNGERSSSPKGTKEANRRTGLKLTAWIYRGLYEEFPNLTHNTAITVVLKRHVKQRQAQQQQAAQRANESLIQKLKRFIQYIKDFE